MSVVQGKNSRPPRNQTGWPRSDPQNAESFDYATRRTNRGRIAPKIAIMRTYLPRGQLRSTTRRRG
jgi:hypothetical protein